VGKNRKETKVEMVVTETKLKRVETGIYDVLLGERCVGQVVWDGQQWRAFVGGFEVRPNNPPRSKQEAAKVLLKLMGTGD